MKKERVPKKNSLRLIIEMYTMMLFVWIILLTSSF